MLSRIGRVDYNSWKHYRRLSSLYIFLYCGNSSLWIGSILNDCGGFDDSFGLSKKIHRKNALCCDCDLFCILSHHCASILSNKSGEWIDINRLTGFLITAENRFVKLAKDSKINDSFILFYLIYPLCFSNKLFLYKAIYNWKIKITISSAYILFFTKWKQRLT